MTEIENQEQQEQTENLSEIFGAPEGSDIVVENDETTEKNNESKEQEESPKKADEGKQDKGEFTPSKVWEDLKSKIGEDFTVPTDVTAENELDKLVETIYSHTNKDTLLKEVVDDPVMKGYLEAKEKGIDTREYLKTVVTEQKDYSSMSDEDKLHDYYAQKYGIKSDDNPNGITEEDIQEHINKLGGIERKKEVVDAELFLKQQEESKSQEYIKQQEEAHKEYLKNLENTRKKETEELYKSLEDEIDVFGVKISKADAEAFREDFETFVTPDDTGVAPILKMLQSNDILLKVAYLLKNQDIAKEALTRAKTTTKKEIEQKLDLTPQEKGGQPPAGEEFDPNVWGRPENF